MSRLCFIVQRYGIEVNGGAELHCRQLAEHMLTKIDDIHVLTSKAIDYITWKNEYVKDEETINGIKVHRFPVEHERVQEKFDEINGRFFAGQLKVSEEKKWLESQGPYCPSLIKYLKEHKDDYDCFIFFTYLYYTTVMGIQEVADKAIVIPTAHDEPFLKMRMYRDVFCKPKGFFYNTEEERILINDKFHNNDIPSELGGVGVELPEKIIAERFKTKYNLDNYIVYVGRIDEGKNCNELFRYWDAYRKRNTGDLKLVLMGKAVIPVPERDDILSLGFVSDEDKFDGISGARALVLPSKFESLSMVVLEAMSLYTPIIVNGICEVLKGHCIKSNGGFYYLNYLEFEGELNYILDHDKEMKIICNNAKKYVEYNYQWDVIVEKLYSMIIKTIGVVE
jgi:glycosyltransferase involved in cell wall biosynthesis